jgi:hypothetical protein
LPESGKPRRQSRGTRATAKTDATVAPINGATDKPEPAPKPAVTVTPYSRTFYRPTIDGNAVECPHDPEAGKYGHDSERAALACARSIAAARW